MNKVDYYKREIEKQAGLISSIATKALPAVKNFTSSSLGKRIAGGAVAGGALKGITYDPEKDGNSKIRAMARGAITGGTIGGLASSKNIARGSAFAVKNGRTLSKSAQGLINNGQDGVINQAKLSIGNFADEYGRKINNVFR